LGGEGGEKKKKKKKKGKTVGRTEGRENSRWPSYLRGAEVLEEKQVRDPKMRGEGCKPTGQQIRKVMVFGPSLQKSRVHKKKWGRKELGEKRTKKRGKGPARGRRQKKVLG